MLPKTNPATLKKNLSRMRERLSQDMDKNSEAVLEVVERIAKDLLVEKYDIEIKAAIERGVKEKFGGADDKIP